MSEGACTIEAMNDIAATLAEVGTALGEVVGSALADGSSRMWRDDEVLELMSAAAQIARHAEAVLIEAASQVDDRSAAPALSERMTNRFGCRSVSELVQRATRVSGRRASELIKAGRAVRQEVAPTSGELLPPEFPAMREALVEGAVGLDALLGATAPIAGLATAAGRAAHLAADEELAAAARGADGPAATADELRSFATVWSMYLDPDGAEPREAKAMRKRGITLGRCQDGIVPIRGGLLPDVAAQLDLLANAVLNPRVDDITRGSHFTEDPDEPASDPDTRTGAQKLHDVFATVLTKAAASGQFPTIGGAAPTLVVSARAEDLASGRGFAHIDGVDEPVSLAVARQVACTGGSQRVLLESNGRIRAIETAERVFNRRQRRAKELRDGTCVIPGCCVPALWCEIHHVEEHARGGPTSTENGVPLCWYHHRTIDTSGWQIRMNSGVPEVRGPYWWDAERRWRPVTKSPTRMRSRIDRRT